MEFDQLNAELDKQNPSRELIMDALDVITDRLRSNFPTTPLVHDLLTLWTRLISMRHWHIQQCALSCTKYIFMNSTLSREAKKEALLKHTDFTREVGAQLDNKKREVREMAAQCVGQLAIQIGPSILDKEFGLDVFRDATTPHALEGQQMALGRLATAFRIVAPENLDLLLDHILQDKKFSTLTNPTDNGYVFWYSTRALLLFVTAKLDAVLAPFLYEFTVSHKYAVEQFGERIEKACLERCNHHYTNVRRTAARVIGELFAIKENGREEYIDGLLPAADSKWVAREGAFLTIEACLQCAKSPLKADYVDKLCQKLSNFVRDPIDNDPAPVNQKGNANAAAGRALTEILVMHDKSLFEKYVHDAVMFLLEAPVALYIAGGMDCVRKLKALGGFPLDDMYLASFKNLGHASGPISDLARRTVPVALLVEKSFEELIKVLIKFGTSTDVEVRESVCKSLSMVSKMTDKGLPQSVVDLAESLAADSNENVAAAALDVLGCALNEERAKKVPELVKGILYSDMDTAIVAAVKLVKASIVLYREAVASTVHALAPILAFHAATSFTPAVSTLAQQLLVILARDKDEFDDELVEKIPFDGSWEDVESMLEEGDHDVSKMPASVLRALITRFCEDLSVESPEEILDEIGNKDMTADQLIAYLCSEEKAEIVGNLARLILISETLTPEQLSRTLQILADVFADETIDFDSKKPLLLALDRMRKKPEFAGDKFFSIPDPTPISVTHHQEGFAKGQAK